MKQYKIGFFIGRFQPFHFGHLSAITQGLLVCEKLLLVIGSANRNFSLDNPLTLDERLAVLRLAIEEEKLSRSIYDLRTLDDDLNNLAWVEKLIDSLPSFDVVVGNNSLVTVLTEYKKIPQYHPKLTKRELLQGKIIRENIIACKDWKKFVPVYSLPLLKTFGLEKRLKDLSKKK